MTDPIQHLRELMAKATPGEWTAPHSVYSPESVLPIFSVSSGQPQVAESASYRDAALIVALRNLAPQLLEVVEAARIYRKTMDEYREAVDSKTPMRAIPFVAAVAEAEKELDEALAALGGKGGGG